MKPMLSLVPVPGLRARMLPLCAGDIGAVSVAGGTFADLREAAFAGRPRPVAVMENAYVAPLDAALLYRASEPSILVDEDGAELARTAASGATACPVIKASPASFAVRRPWDFLRVNHVALGALTASRIEGELSPAAHVDGILHLARDARVLPGVYIEGTVVIGPGCKIGPNCHLRGATSIGAGCHVGQSVEIKNSVLGRNTYVGHLSYVGDSVLGDRVNFGAGTITANLRHDGLSVRTPVDGVLEDTGRRKLGVIAGDGARTGINTSLLPGRKLAAGATTLPGATIARDTGF